MGCDGACSSDGQDLLEALKLGTILQTAKTPEYRDWPTARHTALRLGAANGYTAVGMKNKGGVLEVHKLPFLEIASRVYRRNGRIVAKTC